MSGSRELKGAVHVIIWASVSLVAYLHARAVMDLVGAAITLPVTRTSDFRPRVSLGASTASTPHKAASNLARIASASTLGPLHGPIATGGDPLAVSSCENVQALILAESKDAGWSLALLKGKDGSSPLLCRVGDEVGDRKVAFIGYNPRTARPTVWLEDGKGLCQAALFGPKASVDSREEPLPAPARSGPRRGAPAVSEAIASRIQRVSDREFRIDRAAVDQLLSAPQELMSAARVIPEMQGDKVRGLKILGIRSDTLLGVLGLVNSDRIEAINGYDMTSSEQALEAYLRLRTADTLRVQLTRQGSPLIIDYHIQ